jgi:hypothetical protein
LDILGVAAKSMNRSGRFASRIWFDAFIRIANGRCVSRDNPPLPLRKASTSKFEPKVKGAGMNISPEEREKVAQELKQFATSLNLSDNQKQKLQSFLTDAREKVLAYKEANPSATPQDVLKQVAANRSALRERLVNFLSPEQLTKWDVEVSKAKEFLGQKMAASA